MTLPRYYALQDEWGNAPPLRRLGAAFLKFKPRKGSKRGGEAPGGFEDLVRAFAPSGKFTVIR